MHWSRLSVIQGLRLDTLRRRVRAQIEKIDEETTQREEIARSLDQIHTAHQELRKRSASNVADALAIHCEARQLIEKRRWAAERLVSAQERIREAEEAWRHSVMSVRKAVIKLDYGKQRWGLERVAAALQEEIAAERALEDHPDRRS